MENLGRVTFMDMRAVLDATPLDGVAWLAFADSLEESGEDGSQYRILGETLLSMHLPQDPPDPHMVVLSIIADITGIGDRFGVWVNPDGQGLWVFACTGGQLKSRTYSSTSLHPHICQMERQEPMDALHWAAHGGWIGTEISCSVASILLNPVNHDLTLSGTSCARKYAILIEIAGYGYATDFICTYVIRPRDGKVFCIPSIVGKEEAIVWANTRQ